jgi:hypothetical protein
MKQLLTKKQTIMKKMMILLVMLISFNISYSQINKPKVLEIPKQTVEKITDVVNQAILLDSLAKMDSVFQKQKQVTDSLRAVIIAKKPTPESTPIDWFNWIIGLIVFIVLFIASRLRILAKLQNPLIRRFTSETSKFLQRVQYYCFGINVVAVSILYIGLIPDEWLNIINTVAVASLTLATGILFTTKDRELQK